MPKHLERPSRAPSRRTVLGAVVAVAAVTPAVVAVGQADARSSGPAASPVASVSHTRTYACAGTSARVVRAQRSSATLACATGVRQLGVMRTAVTASAGTASTALPTGTIPGSLLVTTVLTPAGSTVAMPGWARAYDRVGGAHLHLSAWYRTATSGETSPSVTVTPAARVSMITAAFSGARDTAPVATSAGVEGSQRVSTSARRFRLGGRHSVVQQGSVVVVNGNTRLAQTVNRGPKGSAATGWGAVTGALSVLPRPAATIPANAIALPVDGRMTAKCDNGPLTYSQASPTVIAVTCEEPAPTTTPTTTAPTTSTTSATSTTVPTSSTSSTTSTTPPAPPSSTSTPPAPPSSTSTPPAPPSSTSTPPAPPAPTVPSGHVCASPIWQTTDTNGMWSDGDYVVHNNMWNVSGYNVSEKLAACSHSSWQVTATADNSRGDGAVKTYPNVHRDYHDWGTGKEPAWSSFSTLRSTFAAQGPGTGIYDIAYDIWMNGVPGNREIMIWTENQGQRPAGNVVASGVVLSGITWDVWATGNNSYLAFVPRSPLPSGSLDLKAMINYLVGQGRVQANATLGQVCFGVEVVSTDGRPATFNVTDFSMTSS